MKPRAPRRTAVFRDMYTDLEFASQLHFCVSRVGGPIVGRLFKIRSFASLGLDLAPMTVPRLRGKFMPRALLFFPLRFSRLMLPACDRRCSSLHASEVGQICFLSHFHRSDAFLENTASIGRGRCCVIFLVPLSPSSACSTLAVS